MKFDRRSQGLDVSDDSESPDEDGTLKTGYELTEYMKQYNANTKFDYSEGYDPAKLDNFYKDQNDTLYDPNSTQLPRLLGFSYDVQKGGINIDRDTMEFLKDSFEKFMSDPLTIFQPKEMKKTFKQYGYDKTDPAMYSMICWITEANEYSGTDGMTFDEFV